MVETRVVARNLLQADAADGGAGRTEIGLQHFFAHAHSFENLRSAIGTDGADAHLRHHLVKPFADSLDIILLRRFIVHLHLASPHEVIEHGKRHVRIDGAGTIAQEQCRVHHLAYLATLHHQCCFHAFLNADEVVVHRAHGEQGGDDGMVFIGSSVAENDVVHSVVNALLRLAAQVCQRLLQSRASPAVLKEHGQLHCLKTFVTNVAEDVELAVVEHGVRQAHHLAMAGIGHEDVHPHRADILCERHHQLLAYRVDGRVRHLSELLAEIVEEQLRAFR